MRRKNKIWADEYINLASLLDNNRQDDISVTLKKSAGQPIISLSNSSKKEIVNIDQWTRAFLIFSAVYAEKKTIEAGSLFKYISLIRDMAFQRKHWQFYDLQFRRLRPSNQTSWGDIDWELYFRGGAPQSSQGSRPITSRSTNFQQRRDVRKSTAPRASASSSTTMTSVLRETAPTITHVSSVSKPVTPHQSVVPVGHGRVPPLLNPQNNPSPIRSYRLERLLLGYDIVKSSRLVRGICFGFKIPYKGPSRCVSFNNHRSTINFNSALIDKLNSELDKGRMAGPFQECPLNNFHASPLGIIPKKEPNQFRLIHDLSHGDELSVNYHIDKEGTKVSYELLDQ